jgi:hypothetical protein
MPATAVTKAEFLLTREPPESFTGQKSSITVGTLELEPAFGVPQSDAASANSRKQASIISDVICRRKAVCLDEWSSFLLTGGTQVPHLELHWTNSVPCIPCLCDRKPIASTQESNLQQSKAVEELP